MRLLCPESCKGSAETLTRKRRRCGTVRSPPLSACIKGCFLFGISSELFEDYGVKRVLYGHVHGEDGFRNTIQGSASRRGVSADLAGPSAVHSAADQKAGVVFMIRRAIIIVLDSLGVGEMPDAAKYGGPRREHRRDIFWITVRSFRSRICRRWVWETSKTRQAGRLKVAHPEGVYGRFMEHLPPERTRLPDTGRSQVSIRRNRSKRILMVFRRN